MTDEVRDISIVVRATQAIASLTKMSVALDDLQGATGKTDSQLKVVDRTINKASNTTRAAARTLVILKNELKTMSKESTLAATSVKNLENRLSTANKRLADNKAVIAIQRQTITALTADNARLAESYNKVANAATRANAASRGVRGPSANSTTSGTPVAPGVGLGNIKHDLTGTEALTSSLRYSLYDVAATFGILGAAATVAGTAVFRAGITWDKNFANVVRTSQVTGNAINWLKDEFLDLQSIIPVTSEDLAVIGTLGAQMGVAAANLANFTEITAKFSATSGLGVDEAATALSRLDELLPDVNSNYEKLASVILRTGVNAVATEQQIVRGTSQIAAMGNLAGLTTPEVVALASAMSSLGFSPELQRSVITSSFSKILTATSTVTAQTEKFGAVLGITGKQFKDAWDRDALGTYKELVETIAGRGDAVTVLQDLGLASQRLTPNLLKLGQNVNLLDTALGDTTDEWEKNGELTRQYGIIASTVSARIQVMGQAWEALLVTLDESDAFGFVIDALTNIIRSLRTVAKIPAARTLATIAAVIGTLVGITALGAAGLAAMSAGYIAITLATAGLAAATATDTAITEANIVAHAQRTLGLGAELVVTNALTGTVIGNTVALEANGVASLTAGQKMLGFSSKMIAALPGILRFAGVLGIALAAATALVAATVTAPDWGHDLNKAFNGIDSPEEAIPFDAKKLTKTIKAAEEYQAAMAKAAKAKTNWDQINERAAAGDTSALPSRDSQEWAMAQQFAGPDDDVRAVTDDLEEEILALGSLEEQYAAVNEVAKIMGVTQEHLLSDILPGVGSALGEGAAGAAQLQEETEKLIASQAIWAAALGTTDENLASLTESIGAAASGFFDFGSMLSSAYEDGGGGLDQFITDMNSSITDFESFYTNLGTLTQRGGVQLATLFAQQGPAAAQALTDSLNLGPEQISQIENQMALAAFYASEAFADTFAQNNAILAQVWTLSGNNPEAVTAFSAALNSSMVGGEIDPAIIADLQSRFGFELPVNIIPTMSEEDMTNAVLNAQAIASAQVVELPMRPMTSTSVPLEDEVNKWLVNENGHSIVLEVDPATEEGTEILNQWRASQYNLPIDQTLHVDTSQAAADIAAFRARMSAIQLGIGIYANKPMPAAANGGFPAGLPKFAHGRTPTIFRGPGSGTSDSILARVSNGEAITRARAVRYYGPKMLDDINHMRFPKFAEGRGPVGYNPGNSFGGGAGMNVTVVQNYPTTRDPIKQLKQDAESVVAGIWS